MSDCRYLSVQTVDNGWIVGSTHSKPCEICTTKDQVLDAVRRLIADPAQPPAQPADAVEATK